MRFGYLLVFVCLFSAVPILAQGGNSSQLPPPVLDTDYYDDGSPSHEKIELGRLLFFDKILSGNRNISCATCHHPLAATGDGLSLPIGEGADGLGVTRDTGMGLAAVHERVPRNAPHIFNSGARQFRRMFHDGRVEVLPSEPSGFRSPAGNDLPDGLDSVLAAQAMFPVTSATEMAGQFGENSIADAAAVGNLAGSGGVWEQIADRLKGIDGYVQRFIAAFDDIDNANDITYVHAANAIAAFEATAWRADNSPFDRHLRGEFGAMSRFQEKGMKLFYGKARCSTCHSGAFQTDQEFHAIAMPQIGPGKGDGTNGREDFGRERVTKEPADLFKFRTPSLRNVALTGPWGHDGAYNTLEAVVRHHLDPEFAFENYDTSQAVLPSREDLDMQDFEAFEDGYSKDALLSVQELTPIPLSDAEFRSLLDFLHSLTDPASLDLRDDVPARVPSGLPLYD